MDTHDLFFLCLISHGLRTMWFCWKNRSIAAWALISNSGSGEHVCWGRNSSISTGRMRASSSIVHVKPGDCCDVAPGFCVSKPLFICHQSHNQSFIVYLCQIMSQINFGTDRIEQKVTFVNIVGLMTDWWSLFRSGSNGFLMIKFFNPDGEETRLGRTVNRHVLFWYAVLADFEIAFRFIGVPRNPEFVKGLSHLRALLGVSRLMCSII